MEVRSELWLKLSIHERMISFIRRIISFPARILWSLFAENFVIR